MRCERHWAISRLLENSCATWKYCFSSLFFFSLRDNIYGDKYYVSRSKEWQIYNWESFFSDLQFIPIYYYLFSIYFSGLNKISDLARKIEISVQFGKMTNFLSLLVIALACIIVHAQKTSDQKREYTSKKWVYISSRNYFITNKLNDSINIVQ